MASIKDVAQAAGVSTATVSRVLSQHPHVRPEVRDRVMTTIQSLGYRPNLVARSLRSQHSHNIGLIVSDIRNPFFTAISRAVEDAAYARGYSVVLCNSDEDSEKEAMYLQLMRDTQVAGVIFSPTRQTLQHLDSTDLPLVLIDRSARAANADVVLLDNIHAGYLLTEHLLANGYRRIAALFGSASTTGPERQQGYEAALRDHGVPLQPELIQTLLPRVPEGYAAALQLLGSAHPPDAILTSNSLLTAGALQAIRECKLRIPEDVALAGFDDTTWAELVDPPITLIAQPTEEIGRTATELLLQRVNEPGRPTRKIILSGQLVVRGSSAARPVEA